MNANSLFKAGLTAAQQPSWPDAAAVKAAVAELESFPVSYTHLTLPTN